MWPKQYTQRRRSDTQGCFRSENSIYVESEPEEPRPPGGGGGALATSLDSDHPDIQAVVRLVDLRRAAPRA